jgi:hypothetical protein
MASLLGRAASNDLPELPAAIATMASVCQTIIHLNSNGNLD